MRQIIAWCAHTLTAAIQPASRSGGQAEPASR